MGNHWTGISLIRIIGIRLAVRFLLTGGSGRRALVRIIGVTMMTLFYWVYDYMGMIIWVLRYYHGHHKINS